MDMEDAVFNLVKLALKFTTNRDRRNSIELVNTRTKFFVFIYDLLADMPIFKEDSEELSSAIEELREIASEMNVNEREPYLDQGDPEGRRWTVDISSGLVVDIEG